MPPKSMFGPKGRQTDVVTTFKIYISNLPDSVNSADVKEWFEKHGRTVECEVFRKNFAFVHMEEEECGRAAVKNLNRKEMQGKIISVSVSKNLEPPNVATTKLLVKNLPSNMPAHRLRQVFQKFGLVLEAEVTGSKGVVSLEATGDIRTAINEMNGSDLDGSIIHVEPQRVNLKADKPPPSFHTVGPPKSHGASASQRRPAPMMRGSQGPSRPAPYALGGGYGPSAHVEEFYGNPYDKEEEYYEGESNEFYEEDYDTYYEREVQYEYEAPVHRQPAPQPRRLMQTPNPYNMGAGLRQGIDYVRRGEDVYFEEPEYDLQPQVVARNPGPMSRPIARLLPPVEDYTEDFEPARPSYYSPPAPTRGLMRGGRGGPTGPKRVVIHPPKKKVSRGEPYPSPPVPSPRFLLGQGPPRGGGAYSGPLMAMRHPAPSKMRPRPRNERGGGSCPGLLASARATAAAHAARTHTPAPRPADIDMNDPFAPSAVERKLLQQLKAREDASRIDFTADIILG